MKRIRASLKTSSIKRTIDYLEGYKKQIRAKSEEFVNRLMDIGIKTAELNTGQYKGLIAFKTHLFSDVDGIDGIIIATDGSKLIRQWMYKGTIKSVEVSPLLMAEFGSGWLANVLDDVKGVGQGTFPDQKHAFDSEGWTWTTPDGEMHHSYGEAPTYPMHAASMAMLYEIDSLARKVFK